MIGTLGGPRNFFSATVALVLSSCSSSGNTKALEMALQRVTLSHQTPYSLILAVSWSFDGKKIAISGRTAERSPTVSTTIVDVTTGQSLATLADPHRQDSVYVGTAFSPDGQLFIGGGHMADIWDTAQWKLKYSLPGPTTIGQNTLGIKGVSFSRSGRLVSVVYGMVSTGNGAVDTRVSDFPSTQPYAALPGSHTPIDEVYGLDIFEKRLVSVRRIVASIPGRLAAQSNGKVIFPPDETGTITFRSERGTSDGSPLSGTSVLKTFVEVSGSDGSLQSLEGPRSSGIIAAAADKSGRYLVTLSGTGRARFARDSQTGKMNPVSDPPQVALWDMTKKAIIATNDVASQSGADVWFNRIDQQIIVCQTDGRKTVKALGLDPSSLAVMWSASVEMQSEPTLLCTISPSGQSLAVSSGARVTLFSLSEQ